MTRVTIDALGSGGDGIAMLDGQQVFVPCTAPGDEVEVSLQTARKGGGAAKAKATTQLVAGPDRVAPDCQHFGTCGGCAVQHLSADFMADWKREQVQAALGRRGVDGVTVAETFRGGPGRRRRAGLTAQADNRGAVRLGFHARGSRELIDLRACPVLEPDLARLIAPLRKVLAGKLAPKESARIAMNLTDTGVDIQVEGAFAPGPDILMDLAAFADAFDLARLTFTGGSMGEVPIATRRAPTLEWPGLHVVAPPATFLQADRQVEAEMQRLIAIASIDARRILDLFSGIGTLTAAVPQKAEVLALDSAPDAIAALRAGADKARRTWLKTAVWNLMRDPLIESELKGHDLVILDPPAAGARAQVETLARSDVPRIVYVSCAPGTFARDARMLIDGGYHLASITPLDQFYWSPEIELLAVFDRR
ncbi:MAG: hypothetical protein P1U65_14530 [Minwuia sp.]|nr:hypothetical protein [Minwuia sp.]